VSEQQLRPTLAARQTDGRNRLLVGYDHHPASRRALLVAAQLAEALDAHLTVMHVVNLEDYPVDPDRSDWEEAAEKRVAEQQQDAERLLGATPVRWAYQTVRDDPARALAKVASDLDVMFIIVGATGRNVVRRLTSGSVPQSLFRHQSKPVLVVPEPPRAD
jgi:nucleotide-binding universal stress UspA family protein